MPSPFAEGANAAAVAADGGVMTPPYKDVIYCRERENIHANW